MRAMQERAAQEAERSAAEQQSVDPSQRTTIVGEQTDERPEPDREAADE
jgi:hypothetical protein